MVHGQWPKTGMQFPEREAQDGLETEICGLCEPQISIIEVNIWYGIM